MLQQQTASPWCALNAASSDAYANIYMQRSVVLLLLCHGLQYDIRTPQKIDRPIRSSPIETVAEQEQNDASLRISTACCIECTPGRRGVHSMQQAVLIRKEASFCSCSGHTLQYDIRTPQKIDRPIRSSPIEVIQTINNS
ncbi:hypothetical protein Tcan_01859 [Toxocara canis]|uniref:Uncharacterized protein n=1 Tax=Toxocara canis TaxID=6265 RepID=A0A0B2W3W2_TOXCA|nr:hypothetical protein Tcan_01859 [Toxocara canis]